jgi:hypothetical protein
MKLLIVDSLPRQRGECVLGVLPGAALARRFAGRRFAIDDDADLREWVRCRGRQRFSWRDGLTKSARPSFQGTSAALRGTGECSLPRVRRQR